MKALTKEDSHGCAFFTIPSNIPSFPEPSCIPSGSTGPGSLNEMEKSSGGQKLLVYNSNYMPCIWDIFSPVVVTPLMNTFPLGSMYQLNVSGTTKYVIRAVISRLQTYWTCR